MPDFGKGGTRDITANDDVETVRFGDGEYLHFALTASGAEPLFSFTCLQRDLLTQFDFENHPTDLYEWEVGSEKQITDDEDDDVYSVGMSFITAREYTLVVERRRANDSVIKTLINITYTSDVAEDKFVETIRIFRG
jgi:hypothetical protein